MEIIFELVLVLLLGSAIYTIFFLNIEDKQQCPRCGKLTKYQGAYVEKESGKIVYQYKCDCGYMWKSYKRL